MYQDVNLRSYFGSIRPPTRLTFGFRLGRCIILHFPKRTFIHFFLPRRPRRQKRREKSRPGKGKGQWWAFGKVGPIESGVVVPAKTTLRNHVTSASPDFLHSWAVPSSRVSTRNRFGKWCAPLFFVFYQIFLFILCVGMLGEPVYAMEPRSYLDLNVSLTRYGEPVVLPPQQEWIHALGERDLFARIRGLQTRDYYNLPPQNHPGEYEGLVRDHLEQALNLSHRREIVDTEMFELAVLEKKGLLQNKILLLMRNDRDLPAILRLSPYYRPNSPLERCIRVEAYHFIEDKAEQVGSLQDPFQRELLAANFNLFLKDINQNGRNSQIYREFYSHFTGGPPTA